MDNVKVLLVQGQSLNRGIKRVTTLPEEIEKAINAFKETINGSVSVVKVEVDFSNLLSTGGQALVVLGIDGDVKPVAKAKGGK